jgi:uncharacterized protein (DUF2147 family)
MRPIALLLACATLVSVAAVASARPDVEPDPARSSGAPWAGTWTNMNHTMHVRATRCGDAMCGIVVWADEQTKADIAARGRKLIGTQVFRDFRQTGANEWKGVVYVPAINKSIPGRIELTDPESITASACILGPIGCQTRHYKRIR